MGRFLVGPELGRGGMGRVHAGWDPMLRRQVALKLLHQGDPIQVLRFMREAQVQAKVDHPLICKILEVGSEGDQPFIAMELIHGRPLGELRGDLDLRASAQIMAEVAGAIHAAHRAGLVHRDLKPSNILIEGQPGGTWIPRVVDFGLARDLSVTDQSLTWGLVGTPAFMSPEQARAEDLTPASDLYSLGATFFAFFAGHPPFEATSVVGLVAQQDGAPPVPLAKDLPGFPRDLQTILGKCLDPQPAGRYATAWELQEDLRRWLAGEPILARPLGPGARLWRKVKRRWPLSLAIAVGLLATASLGTWSLVAMRRSRAQLQVAQTFALQIREVEQLLRIDRMLPDHDTRPAEDRVRQRMGGIRQAMGQLGAIAQGPGHYALGRGHLSLQNPAAAEEELTAAWAAGFRTPEVAYARGSALLEQFLAAQEQLHESNPVALEAALRPLRARWVEPALACFTLAQGHAQEHPAFGEAQVAMLRGDHAACIAKCREAFAAAPWMYEAKLLEARALRNSVFGLPGYGAPPREVEARLQEALRAVHEAGSIAHSDQAVLLTELALLASLTYHQADQGNPSEAPFRRAEELFSRALLLHPDHPEIPKWWVHNRIRRGFFLLGRGADAGPLMRASLERVQAEDWLDRGRVDVNAFGQLLTLQAESEWRRGVDPRPTLSRALRVLPPQEFGRTQTLRVQADDALGRGLDPSAILAEGMGLLDSDAVRASRSFWHESVHAVYHLDQAEWAAATGQDPLPHLDRALQKLASSRSMSPGAIYAHYLLVQAHAFRARRALAWGQDPAADLQAAEAAGLSALRIAPGHFRVQLALAGLHLLKARVLWLRGGDPDPALDLARQAVRRGLEANPTDFRLHLASARAETQAATLAWSRGASPLPALERAERAARLGLASKGDGADLWAALARIERLRLTWARRAPAPTPHPAAEAGLRAVLQALRVNPSHPVAQLERVLLADLQAGGEGKAQDALAHLAAGNQYLAWEYREPQGEGAHGSGRP